MATPPGNGLRTACDILCEISYHVIEQIVDCLITSTRPGGFGDGGYGEGGYGGPNGFVIGVSDLTGFYVGAQVVVGWQTTTAEVATVYFVDYIAQTVFLAALANAHAIGVRILAPTFPTQAPSDPLWTQVEMLEYLARAQNEFLLKCPCIYEFFADLPVLAGAPYQATPVTAIEIERVALQSGSIDLSIASITRTAGVVTALLTSPSTFTAGLPVWVDGVIDSTFNSPSTMQADQFILTGPAGSGGLTLTWSQTGPNASSSAGTVSQLLYPRLYETTQDQISLRDSQWFYNQDSPEPTAWYEDRTGKYNWGLAPVPRGNYFVELLASVRDSATLGLLDRFLLPDICVPYIKYRALATALEKDGEARSPSYARYCNMRFELGLIAVDRYLRGFVEAPLSQ